MQRRHFIKILGGAAAGWPLSARRSSPRSGVSGGSRLRRPPSVNPFLEALRARLTALGYTEGRNLTIAALCRWGFRPCPGACGGADQAAGRFDCHAGYGNPPAAKVSTKVPVAYVFSADPVLAGIADSLARPGRNMTGISLMSVEMNGKRLELLREILPRIRRVAIFGESNARRRRIGTEAIHWRWPRGLALPYNISRHQALPELRAAYAGMTAEPPQAIVVFPDPVTGANRSANNRLRGYFAHPGLSRVGRNMRTLALCAPTDRDLRDPIGGSPTTLIAFCRERIRPGCRSSARRCSNFVINLKTAKALGIEMQPALIARADRLVE